jgi:hypothetical protein
MKTRRFEMKRYAQSVLILLTLMAAAETFAQDEEPQLEEYMHNEMQEPAHAPQRYAAMLDRAFHAMYDLDFRAADLELSQFSAGRPDDPLGPAAQAASVLFSIFERHKILQSEFFSSDDHYAKRATVIPQTSVQQQFRQLLERAEQLATRSLAHDPADQNALFSLTLVYGLRADYAALIEHRDLAALHLSDIGNGWARKLLVTSPQAYDAYVAIGIHEYLVGLRPAPVRWMLRLGGIKGDREEGLHDLELGAEKGHYLAPLARILLAIAHLRQHQQEEAIQLLAGLRQQFPHNPLFAEEVARLRQSNTTSAQRTSAFKTAAGSDANE